MSTLVAQRHVGFPVTLKALVKRVPGAQQAVRLGKLLRCLPWQGKLDVPAVRVIYLASSYSQLSWERLANVYTLSRTLERNRVPGAFVECGVWRGGSAAIMAFVANRAATGRKVWLFDSFEGMPEATEEDGAAARDLAAGRFGGALSPVGTNVASMEGVQDLLFRHCRVNSSVVSIRKGWFQDTLPRDKDTIGPIALLRLDGDWYESTKVCLDELFDQVIDGGYVIIDDYGFFPGCKKAVDEFFKRLETVPTLHRIDREGVFFRKTSA